MLATTVAWLSGIAGHSQPTPSPSRSKRRTISRVISHHRSGTSSRAVAGSRRTRQMRRAPAAAPEAANTPPHAAGCSSSANRCGCQPPLAQEREGLATAQAEGRLGQFQSKSGAMWGRARRSEKPQPAKVWATRGITGTARECSTRPSSNGLHSIFTGAMARLASFRSGKRSFVGRQVHELL